jgi:hypothetical protein
MNSAQRRKQNRFIKAAQYRFAAYKNDAGQLPAGRAVAILKRLNKAGYCVDYYLDEDTGELIARPRELMRDRPVISVLSSTSPEEIQPGTV